MEGGNRLVAKWSFHCRCYTINRADFKHFLQWPCVRDYADYIAASRLQNDVEKEERTEEEKEEYVSLQDAAPQIITDSVLCVQGTELSTRVSVSNRGRWILILLLL